MTQTAGTLLDDLEQWARNRLGDEAPISRGHAALSVVLHPTAEAVEFSVADSGTMSVSAKTSTTGPGYHAYLVELLDDLAKSCGLTWSALDEDGEPGDETGYFESRDRAELEHQMLMWLRALAGSMVQYEGTDFDVCLSIGYRYELRAHTRTPLGPRDLDYWKQVADEPRHGIDFFAWWEAGQGAGYHLGLALALMWSDVRWRTPSTDTEELLLLRVTGSLRRAYEDDPARAYPWREWAELLGFLDQDGPLTEEVHRRARGVTGPLIGYRRHPVRVPLAGGWSIKLPGEFAEEWDKEGTFSAWAGGRTVWFTAFSRSDAEPTTVEELRSRSKAGDESFERQEGGLISYATLKRTQEDGETYWQLSTETVSGPALAIVTICFGEEVDRDWALDTWKSLNRAQKRRE